MRREFTVASSEVYMICPNQLRRLGVELLQRSRANAYGSHRDLKKLSQEERGQIYEELKTKINREGFQRDAPIKVMLCRDKDGRDRILDGHHRLSIAIELGLDVVPVRFVY